MRQHGFSLIELMAAAALTFTITAVALALIDPLQAGFAAQSEAADMQQRLRVGVSTLSSNLAMAGAGPSYGSNTGSLGHYFAPVVPYRRGTKRDDPPGSFRTDTITLLYVPPTVAQTTLATVGPGTASAYVRVNSGPACPLGDARCGFKEGMSILIFDASGAYDTFSITDVEGGVLRVESTAERLTRTEYEPDTTTIVQATSVVYSLKSDAAAGIHRLVSSENGGAEVPIVDHLVALRFEYFGESQPPALTVTERGIPLTWTRGATYGPPPPAPHNQLPSRGYAAGENCTFTIDPATALQVPRLADLGSSGSPGALVPLPHSRLTDGPWCPDETNVNRWDADLLRIRRIAVTMRVQAANAAMRGPAGLLFANGGISTRGNRWLPDLQARFDVTPRNLAFGR